LIISLMFKAFFIDVWVCSVGILMGCVMVAMSPRGTCQVIILYVNCYVKKGDTMLVRKILIIILLFYLLSYSQHDYLILMAV